MVALTLYYTLNDEADWYVHACVVRNSQCASVRPIRGML
jgi:hypothetical protein